MTQIKTTLVAGAAWVPKSIQANRKVTDESKRIMPYKSRRTADENFKAWFEKSERKKMEDWQKQQKAVATGVTSPTLHPTTYISIIEELETENRMLRARNERLTMAMKKAARLLQEHS